MKRDLCCRISLLVALFAFLVPSSQAFAEGSAGIEIGLDSARSLAKGNAVVADPKDASTLVYNPAGLTRLEGNQVAINNTLIVPLTDYTNTSGRTEDSATLPAEIPGFFMSLSTPVEPLKVGAGVNAPFGLVNQYSSTGSFRYTGFSNAIKTMYYTVDGAYEIAPWLSVGGGASYVEAHVKQNSKLNSNFITLANGGPPGTPDANTEVDVKGHGTGWNLGVLVTPNDKLDVGFFYRSQVRAALDGEYNADNLSGPIMTAIFGGSSFRTSADTDITLPGTAILGLNYKATDRLDLEVDFGWTGWGQFDHFDFTYGTTNAVLNAGDPSEHKFRNTFSLNTGLSYELNPNWDVMGGYAYYERAALEPDYSSVFQDGDRHSVAVGLQYHRDNFSIGLAYAAQFVADMHVDNSVGSINNVSVDGEYSSFYHVVVASITYKL